MALVKWLVAGNDRSKPDQHEQFPMALGHPEAVKDLLPNSPRLRVWGALVAMPPSNFHVLTLDDLAQCGTAPLLDEQLPWPKGPSVVCT